MSNAIIYHENESNIDHKNLYKSSDHLMLFWYMLELRFISVIWWLF